MQSIDHGLRNLWTEDVTRREYIRESRKRFALHRNGDGWITTPQPGRIAPALPTLPSRRVVHSRQIR